MMNHSKRALYACVASLALSAAVPALAQNSVGEAIDDVENAATSVGNSIESSATNVSRAADNAVDVDISTDANVSATTTGDLGDADANMAAMEGDGTDMMVTNTTTTTVADEDGDKGVWGLLGLAGLLSFLFSNRKKAVVHLDERRDTTTTTRL